MMEGLHLRIGPIGKLKGNAKENKRKKDGPN